MANSKLRFEECARRILQRELGSPVVLNDDGRENGLVDLCVGDVQSPLIAIECTAALDPVRTETWNLEGPAARRLLRSQEDDGVDPHGPAEWNQ